MHNHSRPYLMVLCPSMGLSFMQSQWAFCGRRFLRLHALECNDGVNRVCEEPAFSKGLAIHNSEVAMGIPDGDVDSNCPWCFVRRVVARKSVEGGLYFPFSCSGSVVAGRRWVVAEDVSGSEVLECYCLMLGSSSSISCWWVP